MPQSGDFRFGPYRLDLRSQRLLRGDLPLPLQPRQFALLHLFVERAGDLLTKDHIIETAWQGTAVSDNSLAQAVSQLRNLLDARHPDRYIETAKRVGYRFVEPVSRTSVRQTDAELDALLAPHRALVDGRAAIETLTTAEVARARRLFEARLADHPDDATFHVGLANACVLEHEAGRTDVVTKTDAIELALQHALEACRLRPSYAEAWATLGFVLDRAGRRVDAIAALRRSVALEPDNWLHHLRLAYVAWGEERLRAARRALELFPKCPMAHWLVATVYVARGVLTQAEAEIDAGLAASALDEATDGRFGAIALHWLKGLLCLARGADDEALASFERELTLEPRGHLYAREVAANTWYAIGACRWRLNDGHGARVAFGEAVARVPKHPLALAGLALVSGNAPTATGQGRERLAREQGDGARALPFEVTLARAAVCVACGDVAGGAAIVTAALADAPPGNAGWTLPIEPLLAVWRTPDVWETALGRVRNRAG